MNCVAFAIGSWFLHPILQILNDMLMSESFCFIQWSISLMNGKKEMSLDKIMQFNDDKEIYLLYTPNDLSDQMAQDIVPIKIPHNPNVPRMPLDAMLYGHHNRIT